MVERRQNSRRETDSNFVAKALDEHIREADERFAAILARIDDLQHPLSDTQMEEIAENAANKAVERMTDMAYTAIGKGVVNRILWVFGLLAVAGASYLAGKGALKL